MKKQSKKVAQKAKAEADASVPGDNESSCPPKKQARGSRKRPHSESQSQERADESMTPKKLVPTFGKKKAISKPSENTQSSVQLIEEIKVAELSTENAAGSSNDNNSKKPKDEEKLNTSTATEDNNKPSDNPANPSEDVDQAEKEVICCKDQTDVIGEKENSKNEIQNNGGVTEAGLQKSNGYGGTEETGGKNDDIGDLPQISEGIQKINGENVKDIQEINNLNKDHKTNSSENKDSMDRKAENDSQENGLAKVKENVSKTMEIVQAEISEKPTNECGIEGSNLTHQETNAMDMKMVLKENKDGKTEKQSDSINTNENIADTNIDKGSSSAMTSRGDDKLLKSSNGEINEHGLNESGMLKNTDMCMQQECNVEMEQLLIIGDKETEKSKSELEADHIKSAQTNPKKMQPEETKDSKVNDTNTNREIDVRSNDLCFSSIVTISVEHREEGEAREVLEEVDIAVPSEEKSVSDGALGGMDSIQAKLGTDAQNDDALQDDDLMDFTFSQMCQMEEQCIAADSKDRSANMTAKNTPQQKPTASSSLNLVEPSVTPQVPSPWKSQPVQPKDSPLPTLSLQLGPSCNLRPGDLKAASVVQGVIAELKELNHIILNAKKQIDAVKRQRQLQMQQHNSPRKQQLRQQKLPMARPTYQPQQRPQQFTPSTSRKGKEQ